MLQLPGETEMIQIKFTKSGGPAKVGEEDRGCRVPAIDERATSEYTQCTQWALPTSLKNATTPSQKRMHRAETIKLNWKFFGACKLNEDAPASTSDNLGRRMRAYGKYKFCIAKSILIAKQPAHCRNHKVWLENHLETIKSRLTKGNGTAEPEFGWITVGVF